MAAQLEISFPFDHHEFVPGDLLKGTAKWMANQRVSNAEMRLVWYTEGRGTQDSELVAKVEFPGPTESEQRDFSFELPAAPYSFSGKLISLQWALELVVDDSVERFDFVLSPNGREILLSDAPTATSPTDEEQIEKMPKWMQGFFKKRLEKARAKGLR